MIFKRIRDLHKGDVFVWRRFYAGGMMNPGSCYLVMSELLSEPMKHMGHYNIPMVSCKIRTKALSWDDPDDHIPEYSEPEDLEIAATLEVVVDPEGSR
jgi:hypothetical protein